MGLARDWTDDASTLIYDEPARGRTGRSVSDEPRLRSSIRAPYLSDTQVRITVVAALIGAMAAAWSIQKQAQGAAPPAQALVTALGTMWPKDSGARVAAAMPRANAEVPSVREPSAARVAKATTAKLQPAKATTAKLQPAKATTAKPQPAKATTAAAQDRRAPKAAASSRSSRSEPARPAAVRSEPARAATPPAPRPAASRMGVLRINSRPWSKVYVDGRAIGSTPQMAIEVTPGRHRIALVSKEFDLERKLNVEVKAGQTVTRSVELLQ